jgi:hypothetical protein
MLPRRMIAESGSSPFFHQCNPSVLASCDASSCPCLSNSTRARAPTRSSSEKRVASNLKAGQDCVKRGRKKKKRDGERKNAHQIWRSPSIGYSECNPISSISQSRPGRKDRKQGGYQQHGKGLCLMVMLVVNGFYLPWHRCSTARPNPRLCHRSIAPYLNLQIAGLSCVKTRNPLVTISLVRRLRLSTSPSTPAPCVTLATEGLSAVLC